MYFHMDCKGIGKDLCLCCKYIWIQQLSFESNGDFLVGERKGGRVFAFFFVFKACIWKKKTQSFLQLASAIKYVPCQGSI